MPLLCKKCATRTLETLLHHRGSVTPPPFGQGHLLPAVAQAAEENGAALAAVQQQLGSAVQGRGRIKQRLKNLTPRAQNRRPQLLAKVPLPGRPPPSAPRAGPRGPRVRPGAREARGWRGSPDQLAQEPGHRQQLAPGPRLLPRPQRERLRGPRTTGPSLGAARTGVRSVGRGRRAAAGATWGHVGAPPPPPARRAGWRAGERVSVGVCWARGAASSRRVASSPGRPRQGEGPLTSVAAGGEVARCEEQHGHQRQHLGAPHAEVVVDLPLAQVVGQSRHLGSSMTTVRGGAGKGRRTGAALGLPPPQPGEEPPPAPAAATRASRGGEPDPAAAAPRASTCPSSAAAASAALPQPRHPCSAVPVPQAPWTPVSSPSSSSPLASCLNSGCACEGGLDAQCSGVTGPRRLSGVTGSWAPAGGGSGRDMRM